MGNCVSTIDAIEYNTNGVNHRRSSSSNNNASDSRPSRYVKRPTHSVNSVNRKKKLYVALYDYESRTDGDLPFKQGDIFEIIQYTNTWWLARNCATNKTGYIPSEYVAEYQSIYAEKWYFGKMKRTTAETKLLSSENQQGAFLIRQSETKLGDYSLSIKDGDSVKHYCIKYAPPTVENGNKTTYYISRRNVFDSLAALIQHYQCDTDGLSTILTVPCVQTDEPVTAYISHTVTDKWEIERSSLKFVRMLGQGQFGEVHQGTWNGTTQVAIKQLKPGTMTVGEFLDEADRMKTLFHPKLIRLYAVCTKEEPILIITELMVNGSLLNYLRKGAGKNLVIRQMIDIGAQVASGMAYLESNNYIHRDLAARNVLVGKSNCVKVADFGLARVIGEDIYEACTGARVPIRWTAPEAFKSNQFSVKSDVWSFGILLMEVVTYGQTPYDGMTNQDVMKEVVNGYRIPRPSNCPEELYETILKTWHDEPMNRPTFESLKWKLEDYYTIEGSDYKEHT